jgi:hypothetical protein
MTHGASSIDALSRSTGKAQTMSFASLLARVCCGTLGLLFTISCQEALALPEPNRLPVADAKVVGLEGKSVTVEFHGQPVAVVLDGSSSMDPDGTIAVYRWLSGTLAKPAAGGAAGSKGSAGSSGSAGMAAAGSGGAAGAPAGGSGGAGTGSAGKPAAGSGGAPSSSARWVPPGQPGDWPADEAMTTVMLGEGEYKFVLWVIDNKGGVSAPDTLTVTVSPPIDPQTKACVDSAYPNAPKACVTCVCGQSDTCRAAAVESMCGADCWGLLNCIATKCPGFMAGGDTSCLVTNCSSYLAGGTGAQGIGPCIVPACSMQCSATN